MELPEMWDKTQSFRGTISTGKIPTWSEVVHTSHTLSSYLCSPESTGVKAEGKSYSQLQIED